MILRIKDDEDENEDKTIAVIGSDPDVERVLEAHGYNPDKVDWSAEE